MGGTRFMVFKGKELIKTAIFAILGVIIIIGLIHFFLPKVQGSAIYHPGTYHAEVVLNGETAQVEVVVDTHKIKSVSLINVSETIPVFYPLVESTTEELSAEIVKNQSLSVEFSPQNAYTAELILDAAGRALEEASK